MSLKGLIFDFDGLILDTEYPVFTAWQEVFASHNQELPVEIFAQCLGSSEDVFHPLNYLEECLGKPLNRSFLLELHKTREQELLSHQQILPGVNKTILRARELGMHIAIASSSDRNWVMSNLERIQLQNEFDLILTSDEVRPVKPAPDLFLKVLSTLGLASHEMIVLEDSPNGITAAKTAGIFVVAIPNPVSSQLDISNADLILRSMCDLDLDKIFHTF